MASAVTSHSNLGSVTNYDEELVLRRKPTGFWTDSFRRFRQDRMSLTFGLIFLAIVIFVLCAPLVAHITGFSYSANHLDLKTSKPGENGFILGSDGNGRDVLTRLAYGGRISLVFAFGGMVSVLIIGCVVGGCSGFFGGIFDNVAMRIAEILLAMPVLPLLILVSAMYRPSVIMLAAIVGVF
ncbi:MAG TPA: hypothetical protein PK819_06235, partial [Thermomicrobiales bacterium]|nr:hypothetical protein [Thermomicrobiales bacterium]